MDPVLWSPLISLDAIPGMQVTIPSPFPGTPVPCINVDPLQAIYLSSVLQIHSGFLDWMTPNILDAEQ